MSAERAIADGRKKIMKTCLLISVVCLVMTGAAVMAQDQMPKQPKFLVVKGIQEDAN